MRSRDDELREAEFTASAAYLGHLDRCVGGCRPVFVRFGSTVVNPCPIGKMLALYYERAHRRRWGDELVDRAG